MIVATLTRGLLVGVPVTYIFVKNVGYIARVEGVSMQPSLNPNDRQDDYVFLNQWSVNWGKGVEKNDIVIFKSPKFPFKKLIKRVVGLPGDVIHTRGYREEIVKVPENKCWVEGDHVGHSMDSNTFGPIDKDLISAKATHIIWPPSRWQTLNNKSDSQTQNIAKNSQAVAA